MPPVMPKSPANPKQQIGARVDQELLTEVRVLALRRRMRFNEVIEEALRDLLKKYKDKRKD